MSDEIRALENRIKALREQEKNSRTFDRTPEKVEPLPPNDKLVEHIQVALSSCAVFFGLFVCGVWANWDYDLFHGRDPSNWRVVFWLAGVVLTGLLAVGGTFLLGLLVPELNLSVPNPEQKARLLTNFLALLVVVFFFPVLPLLLIGLLKWFADYLGLPLGGLLVLGFMLLVVVGGALQTSGVALVKMAALPYYIIRALSGK